MSRELIPLTDALAMPTAAPMAPQAPVTPAPTGAPGAKAARRSRRPRRGDFDDLPPRSECVPVDDLSLPPLPAPGPHWLNVLEGAVVDFPTPVLHPAARRWAATCWPDPTKPGGWGRALWWPSPYHRGWQPVELVYAAAVEFAADVPTRRGRRRWWTPVRWYGVLLQDTPSELVLWGPYPSPAAASTTADELRAMAAYDRVVPRRPR